MGDIFDQLAGDGGGTATAAPPAGGGGDIFDHLASQDSTQHAELFKPAASSPSSYDPNEEGFVRRAWAQNAGQAALANPANHPAIKQYVQNIDLSSREGQPAYDPQNVQKGFQTANSPTPFFNPYSQDLDQNGEPTDVGAGKWARSTATPDVQAKYDTLFRTAYQKRKAAGQDPYARMDPASMAKDAGLDPVTGQPVSDVQGDINAAKRGVVGGTIGMAGKGEAFLADAGQQAVDWFNGTAKGGGVDPNATPARGALSSFAQNLRGGAETIQQVNPQSTEAAKNPYGVQGMTEGTIEAGATMATQAGVTGNLGGITKPAGVAAKVASQGAFLGTMAGSIADDTSQQVYEQLKNQGVDEATAKKTGLVTGAVSAAVQTFVQSKLGAVGNLIGTAEKTGANTLLSKAVDGIASNLMAGRGSDAVDQLMQFAATGKQPDAERFLAGSVTDAVLGGIFGMTHGGEEHAPTKQKVQQGVEVAREGFKSMGVPPESVDAAAQEAVKAYQAGGEVDLQQIASKYTAASTGNQGGNATAEQVGVTSSEVTPKVGETQVPAASSKMPEKAQKLVSDMSPEELDQELAGQDKLVQRAEQLSKGGSEPVRGALPNETDLTTGKMPEKVGQKPAAPEAHDEEVVAAQRSLDEARRGGSEDDIAAAEQAVLDAQDATKTKLPTKVTQAPEKAQSGLDPKVEAALPDFTKAMSADYEKGGKQATVQVHQPESAGEKAADLIAQHFGRKLAIFTSDNKGAGGGVHPKHPDVIFVRRGGTRPLLDVLGHEMLHSIRRVEGDKAYKAILDFIKTRAGAQHEEGKRQYQKLAEGSPIADRLKKNADLNDEEGAAMVFGRLFTSRDFHAEFSKLHPDLYSKIKEFVVKFVNGIKDKISTSKLTAPPEVQQEAARELQNILDAASSKEEIKSEPAIKTEPKPDDKLPGRVLKVEPTKPVSEAEKTGEKMPAKAALADKSTEWFSHAMKSGEYHPDMVKEMGGDSNEQVEAYRQQLVPKALAGDEAAQTKLAITMLPGIKSIAKRVLGPRSRGGMEDAIQAGLSEVQRFINGSSTRQQPGETADAYGMRRGKSPLAGWSKEKGDVYSLIFNSLKSSLIRHLEEEHGHNITSDGEGAKEVKFHTDDEGHQSLDRAETGREHTNLREDEASRGNLPKAFSDLPPASRDNLVKTLSERFAASMESSGTEDGVKVKFASKGQEGNPSDNPDRVHGWRSPSGKKLVTYRDSAGWHYADYGAWAEGEPNWQTVRSKDEVHSKFEQAWKDGKMTAPINDVAEVLNSKFDAGRVDAVYLPGKMGDDGSIEFDRHEVEERADANWIGRTLKNNLVDVTDAASSTAEALKSMKDDLDSIFRPAARSDAAGKAAGVIREKGSDLSMKRERAITALAETRKMFKKMKPQDNYDFIDRMENGLAQPNAKLQAAADALRNMLDNKRDDVKALGKGHFASFIADYFPHIWERPGVFGALFGKRPFEGSKAFLKARKYDKMSDGIKAGLVPVSDNPVDLALLKMHEMDRYIMAQQTFEEFKKMGLVKFKREAGKAPIGMKAIDDRIVRRYIKPPFKGAVTKVGEYVAPEHVANVFNNYLSPGLRDKPWFRGYVTLGNMMNQAQLGLSGFHVLNTAIDASTGKLALALKYLAEGKGKEAAKQGVLGASFTGWIDNLFKGNAVLREWRKPGTGGSPEIAQIVDAMKAAGGRASMDSFYKTGLGDSLLKQFNRGNYLGALLRVPGATAEAALKPVMEWWVPRLKMGAFMDMARFELAKLPPGASREQVRERMGKAWDSVDNRMGEMVYDNLFWNKAAKDMAMASMRSVGWNLGTVRELLGGVKDAGSLAAKMVGVKSAKKAEFSHRLAYLIAMPAMSGMMGGTIHYLLQKANGASDESAVPQEWKDWFFPKTGEKDRDGNDVRLSLPTYMKDLLSYANNPLETVANKTHPLLNTLIEMMQNRDYYNTKIRNEDDPAYKQIGDLLAHFGQQFEPFSSREVRKLHEEGQGGGREFLPLLGIVHARHDITDSPALALAKQLTQENAPQGARTSEEADKAHKKSEIIRKIRNNDPDAEQAMDSAIDTGLINDRGTVKQAYQKADHSTLWGLVENLDVPSAMKVMEKAKPSERKELIDGMWKKLKEAKSLSPEDKDKYLSRMEDFDAGLR